MIKAVPGIVFSTPNHLNWFTRRPLDKPNKGDYEPFESEAASGSDESDSDESDSTDEDSDSSDEENTDEEPSDEDDSESTDEAGG